MGSSALVLVIKTISTSALGVGLLGVVLGRSFLERFVNRQGRRW